MTILGGLHQIAYGTRSIDYELTYSDRKTLAIHVFPDGSIVVDAPDASPLDMVEAKVRKRAAWIVRQQRQFAAYAAPSVLPRRYVSGESYRYLGRQYRLKVVADPVSRVHLVSGYLTVSTPDPADTNTIARQVGGWYRTHARRVFHERLALCYPRVQPYAVPLPDLAIRDMKARWGSCTPAGRITLNLRLIQAPKHLLDYVLLHELCHLKELNHSAAFYALLDRVLPDWRDRRHALNQLELT